MISPANFFGVTASGFTFTRVRHKSRVYLQDTDSNHALITDAGKSEDSGLTIRHRSAVQNESSPNQRDYYTIVYTNGSEIKAVSSYYSKWGGYLSSLLTILPPRQIEISVSGLRAPPFIA